MKNIRFIHTADLHLDSPFAGLSHLPDYLTLELRESPFRSFQGIIELAIRESVDFILIAGDLFDGENRSLRTQVRLRREMERLHTAGIEVFVIHGNHDHLGGSWVELEMPANVHIFGSRTEVKVFEKKDGSKAVIYGFSYPKRHVTERMIDTYSRTAENGFHIGMLHGSLEGVSGHSPYAPFTLQDLSAKRFDYWALGHIHKRQIVMEDPPALYPGNIQGRSRKESGAKGCFLIEMDGTDVKKTFHETSVFVWDTLSVTAPAEAGYHELLQEIRKEIKRSAGRGMGMLLDIAADISLCRDPSEFTARVQDETLRILQEEAAELESRCWPFRLQLQGGSPGTAGQTPFTERLHDLAENYTDYEQALELLFEHKNAGKYLNGIEMDEREQLLKEAEQFILQLIHS